MKKLHLLAQNYKKAVSCSRGFGPASRELCEATTINAKYISQFILDNFMKESIL